MRGLRQIGGFEGSRRGGVLRSALFLAAFLSALSALLWMVALPTLVGARIERETGCAWEASRFSCNPFGFGLRVEDAILWNAPEFGEERPLLAIRSLEATSPFKDTLSGEGDIDRVDLYLSRMTLVIDERGNLNLDQFARDLFGEDLGFGRSRKILNCRLKVDVVEIVDYSGPKVVSKSLRLGVNVDDYEAKGVVGIFEPVFRILARSENLPEGFSSRKSAQSGSTGE